MTVAELVLLANSINEAMEAVDDWEFSTRLGAEISDARRLHNELRGSYEVTAGLRTLIVGDSSNTVSGGDAE